MYADLADRPIDWPNLRRQDPEALRWRPEPFSPLPHQKTAVEDVVRGFDEHDRGKLIMACGTGKTFTAMCIAEVIAGVGGRVLYLAPSISLFQQSMRAWSFKVGTKTISAAAVHHVGWVLYGRANSAGIIEDFSARTLAADARLDPRTVRDSINLYRQWRAIRSVRAHGRRRPLAHRINLGGLDWPAGRKRAAMARAERSQVQFDFDSGSEYGPQAHTQYGPQAHTQYGPQAHTQGLYVGLHGDLSTETSPAADRSKQRARAPERQQQQQGEQADNRSTTDKQITLLEVCADRLDAEPAVDVWQAAPTDAVQKQIRAAMKARGADQRVRMPHTHDVDGETVIACGENGAMLFREVLQRCACGAVRRTYIDQAGAGDDALWVLCGETAHALRRRRRARVGMVRPGRAGDRRRRCAVRLARADGLDRRPDRDGTAARPRDDRGGRRAVARTGTPTRGAGTEPRSAP